LEVKFVSKFAEYGERFLELRCQGFSYKTISKRIPVSETTLKKWGLEWADRLRELGDERLKLFVDQQLVELESRLRLRGEQILKLQRILDERDFEKLDDGQLLRLYLKYIDSVQKDVAPMRVEVSSTMENYSRILAEVVEEVEENDGDGPRSLPADNLDQVTHKLSKSLPD
jgi:hypothetical protein